MDCTKQNMPLLTSNKCGLEPAHAPAFLTPDPLQETLRTLNKGYENTIATKKRINGLGKDFETRQDS